MHPAFDFLGPAWRMELVTAQWKGREAGVSCTRRCWPEQQRHSLGICTVHAMIRLRDLGQVT